MLGLLINEARLRVLVWASLISEILIVVTGAAVRLTGSGLGCPTWPRCTNDSLITVPEMGIHGVIEFGNRVLTFVLLLIAVLTMVAAFRLGKSRRLRITAAFLIVGILVQAVIGGITVLTDLNPWIVGLHFIISALMIALASLQLWRTYEPQVSQPTKGEVLISRMLVPAVATAVAIGVVVTGSGPHAGDALTPRNGLDGDLWQHIHSYPGYLALALALWQLLLVRRRDIDRYASRLTFWLFVILVAQAIVGIAQSRLGLPVELVIVHVALASIAISLTSFQLLVYGKNRR